MQVTICDEAIVWFVFIRIKFEILEMRLRNKVKLRKRFSYWLTVGRYVLLNGPQTVVDGRPFKLFVQYKLTGT